MNNNKLTLTKTVRLNGIKITEISEESNLFHCELCEDLDNVVLSEKRLGLRSYIYVFYQGTTPSYVIRAYGASRGCIKVENDIITDIVIYNDIKQIYSIEGILEIKKKYIGKELCISDIK